MHEVILSVGIDIGTSTTQLIFSRLTIENRASSYTVPRIDIVDKEVIYRSKIYFTPLRSATEIDAEAVKRIVREEYQAAGMTPEMLRTGAVIITGETARKENANEVLEALSDLAGDFVVATAGPDLESVLSARGAGTDALSKEKRTAIANVDIGGGTSNIAVYEKGVLRGTCCLDIGGRLIKVENGRISYIFPKIQALAAANGISLAVGDRAYPEQLYGVCRLMAAQLALLIPEDYPVIDSYMQELHDLHVQGRPDLFIPASHIYSEADFREITTDGNHIALAMTDDHFIAGFIIAAFRTKSNMVTGTLIAYVDDMFVHPSYRGQKIATTLFHEMERRAKELGAKRIDLMVWEFNESAQELYQIPEIWGITPDAMMLRWKISA